MESLVKENMSKAVEAAKGGKYVYCIIGGDGRENFGHIGIGEREDEVYTLCFEGIAAVVSTTPITKYPITRKNTIAHQKVLEKAMKNYTVLPVRFCTIAEGKDGLSPEDRIRERVLKGRYDEFKERLEFMNDKVELGVKVIWTNMDNVFKEIVEENPPIKSLKQKIMSKSSAKQTRTDRVHLGEMVKNTLEAGRAKLETEIMEAFKRFSVESKTNKIFGDSMIVNAAFLVNRSKIQEFDKALDELDQHYKDTVKFKYVGPIPPINFIEIVIHWE